MPVEPRILPLTDNLRAAMWRADDNPRAVIINFQARRSPEAVAFRVITSAPIISSFWEMPSLQGAHWLSLAESRATNFYAIAIADHTFLDQPFVVGLELDADGDPQDYVTGIEIWNKAGAEPQIIYIDTTNIG